MRDNHHLQDFRKVVFGNIVGNVVLTKYNYRAYRIDDISWNSSPKDEFVLSSGRSISYVDYYKETYGLSIQDLNQPLLLSRSRVKSAAEKETDRVYGLIPELCYVTGISEKNRSNFRWMKEISQVTHLSPEQRHNSLLKYIENVKSCPEAREVLNSWGFEIDQNPVEVAGKLLKPANLTFGQGKNDFVKEDWTQMSFKRQFLTPIHLTKWMLVFPKNLKLVAQTFSQALTDCSRNFGIKISSPKTIMIEADEIHSYLKALRDQIDSRVQIVVAIFPHVRSDRYSAFKKLCCLEIPVPSQVILAKTLNGPPGKVQRVVGKIAMQMNCKLGGELVSLFFLFRLFLDSMHHLGHHFHHHLCVFRAL